MEHGLMELITSDQVKDNMVGGEIESAEPVKDWGNGLWYMHIVIVHEHAPRILLRIPLHPTELVVCDALEQEDGAPQTSHEESVLQKAIRQSRPQDNYALHHAEPLSYHRLHCDNPVDHMGMATGMQMCECGMWVIPDE